MSTTEMTTHRIIATANGRTYTCATLSPRDIRAGYTPHEVSYLLRYGERLLALFAGTAEPKNKIEQDFLRLCDHKRSAKHIGEKIFVKWFQDGFFDPLGAYTTLPEVTTASTFEMVDPDEPMVLDPKIFAKNQTRIQKAPEYVYDDPSEKLQIRNASMGSPSPRDRGEF